MNNLSISQLQTQKSQTELSQMLPLQKSDSSSASEKSSFADFLRDARRDVEKVSENEKSGRNDESVQSRQDDSIARNDEKTASVKTDGEKAEKEPENKEKSEKIALRKSQDDEKTERLAEKVLVSGEIAAGDAEAMNAHVWDMMNMLKDSAENANVAEAALETGEAEQLNLVLGDENFEIDDKMIAWLMSSGRTEEKGNDMSSEDFETMIDAAVEFIPGFASDEEKLESAQNLAVNDPQFFLESVEMAGAENLARGAVKSEFDVDSDKKVASKDSEKKTGAKLSVHDLRTHRLLDENADKSAAKIASDKIVEKSAEKKEINLSMQKQADGNMQMTMELASRAQENLTSSSSQAAASQGSNYQAMLSNAIQENTPEFVKAGNIVLKDNNQGSINLILRPEGLGNVKISLNLDDKNLSAQITVQTKEAMDAFRESIPSLKQAFTESGFDTGSFDLNFSNNQQNFAQGGNDGQNQQNAALFAQKSYGDFVTPSSLSAESGDGYKDNSYGINIVA